MLFFLLACHGEDVGDSAPPEEQEDPIGICGDGNVITVTSPIEGESFAWSVETDFLVAGGSITNDKSAEVEVQCPPCDDAGTSAWALSVTATAADDSTQWAYAKITQVCD